MAETTKLSITLPDETVKWLKSRYPDASSPSDQVKMACKDARDFEKIISARKITEIRVDRED